MNYSKNISAYVLFSDADYVAFDKPTGLSSIAERDKTVENLFTLAQEVIGQRLFIVHRLDKDVSGVIVFAKTPESHKVLCRQFEQRAVTKEYRALVHGIPSLKDDCIDRPIRQFGSGRMGIDMKRGKSCTTRYCVTDTIGDNAVLNVFPLTGRRHQIRVHLYSVGHPILGDRRYGDIENQRSFSRLFLHAHRLSFLSPSGKRHCLVSPVPGDFAKDNQREPHA